MAVLLNRRTRVIVQGLTGKIGSFHADDMKRYGTNVVGGVTPGKGGLVHQGIPVFNTVKGAVRETGAEASIVFVPPPFAAASTLPCCSRRCAGSPLRKVCGRSARL